MGDDNDQARLASMTEKEREEELFNRNERREVMRTRYIICDIFRVNSMSLLSCFKV
jgi:hypothetical protein